MLCYCSSCIFIQNIRFLFVINNFVLVLLKKSAFSIPASTDLRRGVDCLDSSGWTWRRPQEGYHPRTHQSEASQTHAYNREARPPQTRWRRRRRRPLRGAGLYLRGAQTSATFRRGWVDTYLFMLPPQWLLPCPLNGAVWSALTAFFFRFKTGLLSRCYSLLSYETCLLKKKNFRKLEQIDIF